MAVTYSAVRANTSGPRQVFGSDAMVVKTDDSGPTSDVVAVTNSLTTAEAIVDALNGGA